MVRRSNREKEENIKNILIVDDNPANLGLLFNYLKEGGYKVLIAQDGESAINMARISKPDLVLLYIIIPEMNGFKICHILKSNNETRNIPIIFMTALTEASDKVAGFQAGAVDYICKPFHQEEILARIRLHIMLQEQKDQLLRINKEKESILSVVAHDLKAPFASVLGFLELLSSNYEDYTDKERKHFIAHVEKSTNKLYQMLEKLLDWVAPGNNIENQEAENIDLVNLINSIFTLFKDIADNKKINLKNRVFKGLYLYANSNMIASILRNLISNAIKFTPIGGSISISTKVKDSKLEIYIKDTGTGMDEKTKNSLLYGLETFSKTGTSGETGSGLGMIICREFIEKNKGKLSIESQPGQGSTFCLSFSDFSYNNTIR